MAPNSGEITPSEIDQKYKEILISNGINDEVSEVIIKEPEVREGFASQARYVTVKFVNRNLKPLNLFTKLQTSNANHVEMSAEMRTFPTEASFLGKYLPAAKKFCESKGYPNLIDFYPKFYYGDDDMIVLENLVSEKGYILLNKVDRQDLDAAKLAIEILAKHHAISYAFIQEYGGPEKFFEKYPDLYFDAWASKPLHAVMAPMFQNGLNISINILKQGGLGKFKLAIEKLTNVKDKVYDEILKKVGSKERTINVLNHGDFWNNNMMFLKDTQTGKLNHPVVIDMQMVTYNSPVIDLLYYIYSSVKQNVRNISHLKELLRLHLDTFQKVVGELGHASNIKFEECFEEFRKKVEPFALGFGLVMTEEFAAVMSLLDPNKVDMNDWAKVFDGMVQTHLKSCSPERIKEIEAYILTLVEEVEALAM